MVVGTDIGERLGPVGRQGPGSACAEPGLGAVMVGQRVSLAPDGAVAFVGGERWACS
jgi:hypothetical protein